MNQNYSIAKVGILSSHHLTTKKTNFASVPRSDTRCRDLAKELKGCILLLVSGKSRSLHDITLFFKIQLKNCYKEWKKGFFLCFPPVLVNLSVNLNRGIIFG